MNSGKVKTLIIQGVNPVYSWHEDFLAASTNVETVIYIGDRNDETGSIAHYLMTETHPLEAWGDAEIVKGIYSIQQPTIQPLNDARSFMNTLISWLKLGGKSLSANDAYSYIKNYWAQNMSGISWSQLLQDGVYDSSKAQRQVASGGRSFKAGSLKYLKSLVKHSKSELALYSTVGLRDGSLANVSWLQEFPDPVTKICWDNYATVSPSYAEKHSLHEGDVVKLTIGEQALAVPVHIQPGQGSQTIGLALGYGRWKAGSVGNRVGVRALIFAKTAKLGLSAGQILSGMPVSLTKTDRKIPLANVQGHHSMEGRQIVVELSLIHI